MVKEKLTALFVFMERMTVCIVMELVGLTACSVKTEKVIVSCVWMGLAMNVVELVENG